MNIKPFILTKSMTVHIETNVSFKFLLALKIVNPGDL